MTPEGEYIRDGVEKYLRHQQHADLIDFSDALFRVLFRDREWNRKGDEIKRSTRTGNGDAIDPERAAFCVKDWQRTGAFVLGSHRSIQSLIQAGERKIKLTEFGSGPIPPSAFTMALIYPEIDIDLVDIHPKSLELAERAADVLGIERKRIKFIATDILKTDWNDYKTNVAVVETMHRGLLHEPEGAVVAKLASQLKGDPIWLPDEITVEGRLYEGYQEPIEDRFHLGKITEIGRDFRRAAQNQKDPTELIQVKRTFEIPEGVAKKCRSAELLTRVRVYGDLFVGPSSQITSQQVVMGRTQIGHRTGQIQYQMGDSEASLSSY